MAERKERPLRRINRRVVGVLGWPYPVLNAILGFFERLRARRLERLSRAGISSSSKTPASAATYSNIEEYSIWEEPSGIIKVRVVRKAKRGSK